MTSISERQASLRIVFVSAESVLPGYAAHAHLTAVAAALRGRGHAATLVARSEPAYHRSGIPQKVLRYLALHRQGAMEARDADILYLRAHPALLPLVRTAKRRGKCVVVELNGPPGEVAVTYPLLRPIGRLLQRLYGQLLRSADGIVAVTPMLGAVAADLAPHVPVAVVGNGVDTDRFHPLPHESGGRPYAIFFGSLARWHGVPELLDAASRPEWPQGLDLVIAGDGQLGPEVAAAARRLAHCRWLGRVAPARMPKLVGGATIGISPVLRLAARGLDDVSPLKLFEMMACGLPVVASDIPGQAGTVEACGGGLIYPSGDSRGLAEAVSRLFADRRLRESMAAGARKGAEANDWRMKAAAIEDLLFRALGEVTGTRAF